MKSRNAYLREISNALNESEEKVKTDIYWLKRILTGVRNIPSLISSATSSKADKTNGASQITDNNASNYNSISNNLTSNSTQQDINTAINSIISALTEIDIIRPVPTRPIASKDTLNKLYLVPETDPTVDDEYVIYCTINTGTEQNPVYDWKRLDPVRLNLTDYIQKSQTAGLVKNDGTIDTNTYLTSVPNHTQASSTISDMSTETITINYSDSTTETLTLFVQDNS